MKAAESLFEFMPYGAPELLQSRRERLASALLLSSLTTVAAIVAAGGLARLAAVPPVVIAPPACPSHTIESLVKLPPPPPSALPRVPSVPARMDAIPVPVAGEPDLPAAKDEGAGTGKATAPDVTGPATDDALAPPDDDALPPPGAHVWAEQYPEPVATVTPPYPEIARDAGVEGLVIVNVLVGKTGRVLDARLDEKRQVPLLNDAALAAAWNWVFTPALANGKPVAVWTAIPFHFRLH